MALSEDYLRSVSESDLKDRAFTPFEIEGFEKESLNDIKKSLKEGRYKDKIEVQESIDFIENLSNRMSVAINNEKKEGKSNWELESDLSEVKKIFDELTSLLIKMDSRNIDDAIIKDRTPKKNKIAMNHKK